MEGLHLLQSISVLEGTNTCLPISKGYQNGPGNDVVRSNLESENKAVDMSPGILYMFSRYGSLIGR